MSYATTEEIVSMFRNLEIADDNSAVTATEIQLFIDNNTAIINAKVGTLYQLPITMAANPESFKILKQIQMFKVAALVDDILNTYSEGDRKPNYERRGQYLLDQVVPDDCNECPPTLKLVDANFLGNTETRNQIRIAATTGRVFEKGGNNW